MADGGLKRTADDAFADEFARFEAELLTVSAPAPTPAPAPIPAIPAPIPAPIPAIPAAIPAAVSTVAAAAAQAHSYAPPQQAFPTPAPFVPRSQMQHHGGRAMPRQYPPAGMPAPSGYGAPYGRGQGHGYGGGSGYGHASGGAGAAGAGEWGRQAPAAGKKPRLKPTREGGGEKWADPTLDEWPKDDFRIFVGDLGNETSDEGLAKAFRKYASMQRARVVKDNRSGKTKGYGFVSFKDPQDFLRALSEMNGKYIGNRPVKLRKSTWKERNITSNKKRRGDKKSKKKKPKPTGVPVH